MALPEFTKKLIEDKLTAYCEQKIPIDIRDQIRLGFNFRANSVTLYEGRPSFRDKSRWTDMTVAQFRYDHKTHNWTLYYADRNSRWHKYFDVDALCDFDDLLQEVEEDPTGIFWG